MHNIWGFYIFHFVQVSYIIPHLSDKCYSYGIRVAIAEQDSVGGTCVLRGCIPEKLALHNRGMNCIHASLQQRTAKMTTGAANRTTFAVTVVNNLFNSILLKDIEPQLKSNA